MLISFHLQIEEAAYSRQEALELFRVAARASSKPFVFLSAGVSREVFCDMLELVAEAGVKYWGALSGRAVWQGAIPVYAKQGVAAAEAWLAERGKQNIHAINTVLAQGAVPWWDVYGGKDTIKMGE